MDRGVGWMIAAGFLFIFAAIATSVQEPQGCVTDSQCFIQCEKEKGRPCTDEDVFGPSEEDGGNDPDDGEECINPDGQNWCENDRKAFLR